MPVALRPGGAGCKGDRSAIAKGPLERAAGYFFTACRILILLRVYARLTIASFHLKE